MTRPENRFVSSITIERKSTSEVAAMENEYYISDNEILTRTENNHTVLAKLNLST